MNIFNFNVRSYGIGREPGYLSGIALGCRLYDRGFESRQGMRIFLFTTVSRPGLIQPPNQWISGVLPLGVKWPGREASHSPPYNAEVKNAKGYISTPQYAFME
jgi:hypothetical protein